ncbi:putative Protein kinase domain-containing protein [Seiridium unicorne]|uniref:Uncharacterized protein n=1 Tax=Seiridium unicorne TaxID=138068 RepID=A0ABR2V397_9PEZI
MSHLPVPASKSALSVSRGVRNQKDAKTQAIVSNAPQAMSSAQLKRATLGVPIAPRSGTYAEARNRSTTGVTSGHSRCSSGFDLLPDTDGWNPNSQRNSPVAGDCGAWGNGEWGMGKRWVWPKWPNEAGRPLTHDRDIWMWDRRSEQWIQDPKQLYGMAVIDGEEKTALLELLQWILAWRPGERQDAEQVLDAAWMKTWALPAYEKSLKLEN